MVQLLSQSMHPVFVKTGLFFDKICNFSIITTDGKEPRTLNPPENWVSSNNSTEGDPLRRQFYHASEPTRGELKLAGYNDRLPHRS
jgi:hypothetical protein